MTKGVIKEQEMEDIYYDIFRLDLIANHRYYFNKVCDTTFLYWIKDLVPNLF